MYRVVSRKTQLVRLDLNPKVQIRFNNIFGLVVSVGLQELSASKRLRLRHRSLLSQSHFQARHERAQNFIRASGRFAGTNEFSTQQESLGSYQAPTQGLLSLLPTAWVPYAELARLDKPAGTYYLFFPCLFSTLLAAPYVDPVISPAQLVFTTTLFFTGALIMRGAGCTINDLWDRHLDRHVERTRLRPIARGAITPFQGLAFTGSELLAGLVVLLQFPTACFFYATPSLILVTLYPLAKRVTNYPQAVLGLAFSWGAFIGFPALGVDLISDSCALKSAIALYSSCWAWTIVYDMIYAHMDIKDDPAAGIRSIALAHEHNTKLVLSIMSAVQVGLLATAGFILGAGPIFFTASCGGGAITLATMVWRVQLKEVKNCWWWFRNGCLITGGTISAGLLGDYIIKRRSGQQSIDQNEGAHA